MQCGLGEFWARKRREVIVDLRPISFPAIGLTAWFAHVKVLASDELKGRLTGTPDFTHAVKYVEGQFKEIGLKPAGKDGFQSVAFRTVTTDIEYSSLEYRLYDICYFDSL